MTASDYPINFPYGATDAPYSAAHPHRGDDRGCPSGTPVVIDGITIGLTGATGMVTGPHLHIQEWQGDYSNTRKPQNAFAPGKVVNIDPLGTQGDGSFGKFITIQTADGWSDTYCHLSQINVSIGQVIGGMLMVDKNMLNNLYLAVLNRQPDHPGADGYLGQPSDVVLQELLDSPEYAQLQASRQAEADKVAQLTAANLKLTDQITALKATPAVTPDPSVTVTQSGLWAAFKRILGLGG